MLVTLCVQKVSYIIPPIFYLVIIVILVIYAVIFMIPLTKNTSFETLHVHRSTFLFYTFWI
jgi:hypothetical protein